MSGYFVRTVVVGANNTSKVFAQSLAVGARSTQNPEMKTVQKAPARSPPSPRSARDEPAFASLTQTPADGPARSLRRRRAAPTARMTAGLPAVAVRAGTTEVLRIADSPHPENLRFSRTSFATFTKTPAAPIGVAQTTELHAGRQPASPEVTLTARGSTARSPRSSTAHCVRVPATGRCIWHADVSRKPTRGFETAGAHTERDVTE
jgi:hypothetical protein